MEDKSVGNGSENENRTNKQTKNERNQSDLMIYSFANIAFQGLKTVE